MVRPGVEIVTRSAPPTRGAPTDTGVAYFAGIAEKGPTDTEVAIHNMGDYGKNFGGRALGSLLYDACDGAFRTGVTTIHVGRAAGPGAAKDTHTFNDGGAAPSLAVDSIGPGDSGYEAAVEVTGGTFVIVVTDTATDKELSRSYALSSVADAVAWGAANAYVRVRALGANNPAAAGAVALAGGTDDRANITDTERQAALDLFPKTLGPGQLAYPGATTTSMHVALLNSAMATNRFGLLDLPDSSSDTALEAEAAAIRASVDLNALAETYGMLVADWQVIQGVTSGTTRVIPPSAIVAGLIATSDAKLGNPNVPAAGANGESSATLGLSKPAWSDDQRQTLNEAGVNVFRDVYGGFRLYGFRTLAKDEQTDAASAAWLTASNARLRMAIQNKLDAIGERYLFAQLDGRGQKVAAFNGALAGELQRWWALGALYGEGSDDAFLVDTGATVNTPTTLAANELHAVIGLRMSPFAELVYIEVVKVPVTDTL
jgi:hypothetical protein